MKNIKKSKSPYYFLGICVFLLGTILFYNSYRDSKSCTEEVTATVRSVSRSDDDRLRVSFTYMYAGKEYDGFMKTNGFYKEGETFITLVDPNDPENLSSGSPNYIYLMFCLLGVLVFVMVPQIPD